MEDYKTLLENIKAQAKSEHIETSDSNIITYIKSALELGTKKSIIKWRVQMDRNDITDKQFTAFYNSAKK